MYNLPKSQDPIHHKLYHSLIHKPTTKQHRAKATKLTTKLHSFDYHNKTLPKQFSISHNQPIIDYFHQFPKLDTNTKYNNTNF